MPAFHYERLDPALLPGKDKVVGEIAEMCAMKISVRTDGREITLFKSVGTALSDLVAAGLAYQAS